MKKPNQLPVHVDWRRYDSPTVIRRHGHQFLERLWIASISPARRLAPKSGERS